MIEIKAVRKRFPYRGTTVQRWGGMKRRQQLVTYDQLVKRVVYRSSATRGDIALVIDSLVDELECALLDGNSIKIDRLGSFDLSVVIPVVERREELRGDLCRVGKIYFRPSRDLLRRIQQRAQMRLVKGDED